MNMISGWVPSDCIGYGDENYNSHDSSLSHCVIKLRLRFLVYFEYAAKITYCAFKATYYSYICIFWKSAAPVTVLHFSVVHCYVIAIIKMY